MMQYRTVKLREKKSGEIVLNDENKIEFVDIPDIVKEILEVGVVVGGDGFTPEDNPVEYFKFCPLISNGYIYLSGIKQR